MQINEEGGLQLVASSSILCRHLRRLAVAFFSPHNHRLNSLCVRITYNIAGEVVFLEYLHILSTFPEM